MRYFFDTSALVKRYVQETGSDLVDKAFEEANQIIVSAITRIETLSAFRRLRAPGIKKYPLLATDTASRGI